MIVKDLQELKKILGNNILVPEINKVLNSIDLDIFAIHEIINNEDLKDEDKLDKIKSLMFYNN